MSACTHDPRIDQISRCTDELERIRVDQKKTSCGTELVGCFIGHMDWITELHRLIHSYNEQQEREN
jgi:hypothetical protein